MLPWWLSISDAWFLLVQITSMPANQTGTIKDLTPDRRCYTLKHLSITPCIIYSGCQLRQSSSAVWLYIPITMYIYLTSFIHISVVEPEPQISLECTRLWDKDGFMNISLRWSLSTPSPLLAIRRFSVLPILTDVRQAGLLGRIREYRHHRVNTEVWNNVY